MKFEIHENIQDRLRSFQFSQPLNKRHYLTFALAKIRKNEPLTPIEKDVLSEFIVYCLKH